MFLSRVYFFQERYLSLITYTLITFLGLFAIAFFLLKIVRFTVFLVATVRLSDLAENCVSYYSTYLFWGRLTALEVSL